MNEKSILEMVGGEKHINPHYSIKTDLEKRADEYANKEVYYGAYVDEGAGREIVKDTYLDATKAETALLSQHIIDLQKDKGNLTDKVRELEQQIEKMKCCGNCAKRGHICVAEEMQGKLCGKNKDKWELRR